MKYITHIKTHSFNHYIRVELHSSLFTNNYQMINYRLINTGSLVKTIIVNDIDEAKILLQELKLNSFINSRDEFIEELDNFKECYYVQRLKEDDVVIELSD